ncbi:hypothetical protein FQ154_01825 [Paeniglutamicibacter gangotriensis]|uniref:Uncharacterized protein n=1 Tax=Paeniglutamicibacter gangotriensis TaxID=254787 RepID=A0A5B0ELM6_9MICC|nr:hypothetical protein [Paeniglutamicibacter gangotriensis]KAA0979924.1 hypothetical protein FQ154_01825 [Paeniglutamicibacter gangotriensis]
MSVLKNPRFLAAKATLITAVGQHLNEFGLDTDRGEWVVMIGRLRTQLKHKVRGSVLEELLDLLADRFLCEWDDIPLDFDVKDPDYADAKSRWLEAQDDLISAKCLDLMGRKFYPAPLSAVEFAA